MRFGDLLEKNHWTVNIGFNIWIDSKSSTCLGGKTYEIEIYGVPTRVTIAENSLLKTPEEVKAFIESHVSREDFLNGVVVNVSEVSSGNSPQSEMTKEFTVSSLKEPLSVGRPASAASTGTAKPVTAKKMVRICSRAF